MCVRDGSLQEAEEEVRLRHEVEGAVSGPGLLRG